MSSSPLSKFTDNTATRQMCFLIPVLVFASTKCCGVVENFWTRVRQTCIDTEDDGPIRCEWSVYRFDNYFRCSHALTKTSQTRTVAWLSNRKEKKNRRIDKRIGTAWPPTREESTKLVNGCICFCLFDYTTPRKFSLPETYQILDRASGNQTKSDARALRFAKLTNVICGCV